MSTKTNPIDKYLKVDKFVELCSAMHISLPRKPEALLEAYERHGIIRPSHRLHIPEDYAKASFKYKHSTEDERHNIKSLPEWHDIQDFLDDRLQNYTDGRALSEGHPLDWACKAGKTFVKVPDSETYKSWEEYNVVVGEYAGYPQPRLIAEAYYAQWQIFLFEEADRQFTKRINTLLPQEDIKSSFLDTTLSLSKWINEFKILAEYRFKERLLYAKYMRQSSNNMGTQYDEYLKEVKALSIATFREIEQERWIDFIRKLCEIYFIYEESEKVSLSKYLKSYISSTIGIYLESTEWPYSQLVKEVGDVIDGTKYFHWLPLEIILPDEEKEKRREAYEYLGFLKDQYNTELQASTVTDLDIYDIIEMCLSSGNDTLLTKIIEIEKEFNKDSLFWSQKIWSHIRSLATAIETFGKEIFPTANKLGDCIVQANGKYQTLKTPFDNYSKSLNMGTITDVSTPNEFIKKIDIINNPIKYSIVIDPNLADVRFLLIAHITRNFVNHSTKIEAELFGSYFVEIYKSLVFTVFYMFKNK